MKFQTYYTIAALLIAVHGSMNTAPKAPLIITIHGSIHTIENDNGCNTKEWGNKIDDACECCLLQKHTTLGATKTADEIIQSCIQETKQCTQNTIKSLKSIKKIGNGSSDNLLAALYNDVVIRPMVFDTSLLEDNGHFTEKSLPQFLAQAYREKKLPNSDFSKADCLKVKDIATKGGYNTMQLFLITSTCSTGPASMYIIKEAKDGVGEATKLKDIERVTQFKDMIAPKTKQGLPSISLPLAYLAYPDKQTVHYISAMPSAKGKVMSELAHQYQANNTLQNKEILNRAFLILGKETANFHKLFNKSEKGKILGTTVAHGDFHLHNLFFDEIGGHFTLIDNETIALYLKKHVSPAIDICKPFYMPFNNTYDGFRNEIDGIDLKTWYDITLKNFVIGYATSYPESQQKQLFEELKKMFNEFDVPSWVNFYDLEEVREKYITPIFDELIKGKETKNTSKKK